MSGPDIERVVILIDRMAGRQVCAGWQYNQGEAEAEKVIFDSIVSLECFLADAAKLLPRPHEELKKTDLSWEWVVALTLLHRGGSESDWHIGREQINDWAEEMFEDDEPHEEFSETLGDMVWNAKYVDSPGVERDLKALNQFLYLCKPQPCEAARRMLRRLGITSIPGEGRLKLEHEGDASTQPG